jgi:hypothetical protein
MPKKPEDGSLFVTNGIGRRQFDFCNGRWVFKKWQESGIGVNGAD